MEIGRHNALLKCHAGVGNVADEGGGRTNTKVGVEDEVA